MQPRRSLRRQTVRILFGAPAYNTVKQIFISEGAMENDRKNTAGNVLTYVVALIVPLGVGGLSALLTRGNMDIYETLDTPPLSPPSILFPIVWTVLYALMGVSSALAYQNLGKDEKNGRAGLRSYALSLVFNFFCFSSTSAPACSPFPGFWYCWR